MLRVQASQRVSFQEVRLTLTVATQVDPPGIPAAERFPQAFPALFITDGKSPSTRLFGSIEPLGTVNRQREETYTVFIVAEPTAAFPTASGD